ncbi:uncharacterized protein M6B38_103395 [Iris pallida]|uniref:Phosphoribosyltransferase domain-containing protein n=1 Tax=Iris pallida TaxID=29817 RepID=A0AAX6FC00_IRIPA|nr:uncharacterized protein M6B38_103395 [Iris pallida]
MENDIDRVLWTEEEISRRVSELASEISGDLGRTSSPTVIVGVATGALLFLADIVRKIDLPVIVDFVRVESYGSGTESSGSPRITSDVKIDVSGKHVVVIEDIVDTGNTVSCLISHFKSKGAHSISVCTFLDKPARRRVSVELVGEGKFYRGFEVRHLRQDHMKQSLYPKILECPDYFVVGYGMDYAEVYRNLPYVSVLKPEKYT